MTSGIIQTPYTQTAVDYLGQPKHDPIEGATQDCMYLTLVDNNVVFYA